MGENRGGAPGTDVLCVFLDAPLDDSTGSIRWRQLATVACGLGEPTVVVVHDLSPDAQVWLSERLGARVVSLGMAPSGRVSAMARGLAHPRRCWPPTKTDMAAAAKRLAGVLGGDRPAVVWCAGAESWMALPRELRDDAIVDLIDLPSRNRGELARVAVHRIRRRITHDGGVDASIFGLARDVQGNIRNSWLERRVAKRAAGVAVASPVEQRPGFRCVRTGVDDPGPVRPATDPYAVPHFVFLGSFLYPPHQDAAEWFALFVLPPLRQLLPACRIVFAGPCPEWMHAFGRLHDVEITGRLDDPGDVIDGRSIVIAPIRAGSGMIIEVVEAWARGVPVVSTTRGVEGLDAHDGEDVLVADDPAEFAAHCSMAARYPELRDRLVANGRARYEAEFTWQLIGVQLTDWLSDAEKQAGPGSRT